MLALSKMVVGNVIPDLTFFLLMDSDAALARKPDREGVPDRFDDESKDFYEKVIKGYQTIYSRNIMVSKGCRNIAKIDASLSIEQVRTKIEFHLEILTELIERLK